MPRDRTDDRARARDRHDSTARACTSEPSRHAATKNAPPAPPNVAEIARARSRGAVNLDAMTTTSMQVDLAAPLPAIVQEYLARTLVLGRTLPSELRIGQKGTVRNKPGARRMPFTAMQTISTHDVRFRWHARMRLLPAVWIDVVDAIEGGEGHLSARLWNRFGVAHAEGHDVTTAEIQRYLAELPFCPFAFACNPYLSFRELDDRRVEVSTSYEKSRVCVTLSFDDDGDVLEAYAMRPRVERGRILECPWGGRFSEYAALGGIRLPTRAEAWWDLSTGRHVYWRAVVTHLSLV